MPKVIRIVYVLFVTGIISLGCLSAGGVAAELPPGIIADRYLNKAERLAAGGDFEAALDTMAAIVDLQRRHGFEMPEGFHFKHAEMALSAGASGVAVASVTKYLTQEGRKSEFYTEALALLEEAERLEAANNLKCAGQPEGAACWMELTGQPGCYVWNPNLKTDATVAWTGECSGGRARGQGTIRWIWNAGKDTLESTGNLKGGKSHGYWVDRLMYGDVSEGPYVDGKRHGHWVLRDWKGYVSEGSYVDGKRHGHWVLRDRRGDVSEGPYVDGEKHGNWVLRRSDGSVWEGLYVDGKRHGHWMPRDRLEEPPPPPPDIQIDEIDEIDVPDIEIDVPDFSELFLLERIPIIVRDVEVVLEQPPIATDVDDVKLRASNTPLHLAAWSGHTEVAKRLIAVGVDPNVKNDQDLTPLADAALFCHAEVAKVLIAAGADVNAKQYGWNSSLRAATAVGCVDVVRILIAAGADINSIGFAGYKPLHSAVRSGHAEIVEILIAAGADVNAINSAGKKPLDEVRCSHKEVVTILKAAGAKGNCRK